MEKAINEETPERLTQGPQSVAGNCDGSNTPSVPLSPKNVNSATDTHVWAQAYLEGGLSIIPIMTDGSKSPVTALLPGGKWESFKVKPPTKEQIKRWFGKKNPPGIGIVGGVVSGNLNRIDFDGLGMYEQWQELCCTWGLGNVEASLPLVSTPREGGYHVYYRCEQEVGGNTKLAEAPSVDQSGRPSRKTLIETRGEGGYTIAPGSPVSCSEHGRGWELVRGDLLDIPTITHSDHLDLLQLCRNLTQITEASHPIPESDSPDMIRPGDEYNDRGEWRALLQARGWELIRAAGQVEYWRRPGKDGRAWSATFNFKGSNRLRVFSPNAYPLEADKTYSPFEMYAVLEHAGDYRAAARKLASEGYGGNGRQQRQTRNAETMIGDNTPLSEPMPTFELSDMGNGKRLVYHHGQDIRYCDPQSKWYVWDGKRWRPDDTGEIFRRAKAAVRAIGREIEFSVTEKQGKDLTRHCLSSQSGTRIREMIFVARSEDGVPILPAALNADPWLLNCPNGTLDLHTGNLRPHSREDLITHCTGVEYQPEASFPLWDDLLRRVTGGDPDLMRYLQKAAGYSLSGLPSEDRVFLLVSEGGGGKTTFLEALLCAMGSYATTVPADVFMQQRGGGGHNESIANLVGKRLITGSEPSKNASFAMALLKLMSGGDTIKASRKHEHEFEFRPAFTPWIASNFGPAADDTDTGAFRRIRKIPWHGIPVAERNPQVKHLLQSPDDGLPAVLAWMVGGCLMWQAEGLSDPPSVIAETLTYREAQNPMAPFFETCCVFSSAEWTPAGPLRTAYEIWCRENGDKPVGNIEWRQRLTAKGCSPAVKKNVRIWKGIQLAADANGILGSDDPEDNIDPTEGS